MGREKPTIEAKDSHFLKGHASWLYCDKCNKTVAYLCYVTYRYFYFSFVCSCGNHGWVKNQYGEIDLQDIFIGSLKRSASNKRYCCEQDEAALFSPVPKNLRSYRTEIVCNKCNTLYKVSEFFEVPGS